MRNLRLEKKGLRGLAIAESFKQDSKKSILAGIVMRRDFVIDGFVFGSATISGNDATNEIIKMHEKLDRPDISYILISGIIISMYNMVDIKKIHERLQMPVIGVTYQNSQGIESSIKHHFPDTWKEKINEYRKLGDREKINLKTSFDVFVRKEGCELSHVKHLLNDLTLQGALPEPLRIAQLLAKTLLND
ncbi:MAG TPA: DUF99 family protein [Nitrosopumilaceae archaeon]|nr:DUF99 family protein [Nitrosopumilaceae archaeon]